MHVHRLAPRATKLASWAALAALFVGLTAPTGGSADPVLRVLHSFRGDDGAAFPVNRLLEDSRGNLYGATTGATSGVGGIQGTVYKLARDRTFAIVHAFSGADDGSGPVGSLVAGTTGELYGTAYTGGAGCDGGCGTVFKLAPDGRSFETLHAFAGGPDDGDFPKTGLTTGSAGILYGTTLSGGAYGYGTVFRLAPDGTYKVLHSFAGDPSDGAIPTSEPILDSTGTLYGTTGQGGAHGYGSVFRLTVDGAATLLHSFDSEAFYPLALVKDQAGNFYGMTTGGGGSQCKVSPGCGTVFKLTPDGTYTLLHAFDGPPTDGARPTAGLVLDNGGNLYGTTAAGGDGRCTETVSKVGTVVVGCGTAFKIAPDGKGFKVLHSFKGEANGAEPSPLVAGNSGKLYGTTLEGGAFGLGTIFELSGTGFVTATPFRHFRASLEIDHDKKKKAKSFNIASSFVLGTQSDGIDPANEAVKLEVGAVTLGIPAGSFDAHGRRRHRFDGEIGGVTLDASIERDSTARYAFDAKVMGVTPGEIENPVSIKLTIGNDNGSTSGAADRMRRRSDRTSKYEASAAD
jgi:uncharacterized repeat protein (TIGR03803 family)